MDNLHAEKFAIGQNEPNFSYDGSGINPDADNVEEIDDKVTFEDDRETSEVSGEDLKKKVVDKKEEEEEEENGTDYTNILLLGGLLLALLFYKKK